MEASNYFVLEKGIKVTKYAYKLARTAQICNKRIDCKIYIFPKKTVLCLFGKQNGEGRVGLLRTKYRRNLVVLSREVSCIADGGPAFKTFLEPQTCPFLVTLATAVPS